MSGRDLAVLCGLGITVAIASFGVLTRDKITEHAKQNIETQITNAIKFSDKKPKWGFFKKVGSDAIFCYDHNNDWSIDEALIVYSGADYYTPEDLLSDLRNEAHTYRATPLEYTHIVAPDFREEDSYIKSDRTRIMTQEEITNLNIKAREVLNKKGTSL